MWFRGVLCRTPMPSAGADGIGAVLVAVLVDILALVAFVDDDLAGGAVGDRTGDAGFGKDAGGAIGVADLERAVVHDLVIAVDGDRGAAGRLDRPIFGDLDIVGRPSLHGRGDRKSTRLNSSH